MIANFKHKGLERFFSNGDYSGIPAQLGERIERLLDRLDASTKPEDMNLPGFKFHSLGGKRKGDYAVTVTGNWRITFQFDIENAIKVNYEDYH